MLWEYSQLWDFLGDATYWECVHPTRDATVDCNHRSLTTKYSCIADVAAQSSQAPVRYWFPTTYDDSKYDGLQREGTSVVFPEQFEVNKDNHFASLSTLYHSAIVAAFKISVNPSVPLTATSRNVRKIVNMVLWTHTYIYIYIYIYTVCICMWIAKWWHLHCHSWTEPTDSERCWLALSHGESDRRPNSDGLVPGPSWAH